MSEQHQPVPAKEDNSVHAIFSVEEAVAAGFFCLLAASLAWPEIVTPSVKLKLAENLGELEKALKRAVLQDLTCPNCVTAVERFGMLPTLCGLCGADRRRETIRINLGKG